MSIEQPNWHEVAKERKDLREELKEKSGKDWRDHKMEEVGVAETSSHNDVLSAINSGDLSAIFLDAGVAQNDKNAYLKTRLKELDAEAVNFSLKNKKQVDGVRQARGFERVEEDKFAAVSQELSGLETLSDSLQKEEFQIVKNSHGQFSQGDKMRLSQIVEIARAIEARVAKLKSDPEKYTYCRMHELATNQREIREFGFAAKESHKEDMKWIKKRWEESAPVLLEGATGTGKTELLTYMGRKLYGKNPEALRCTERTGPADIFGKTLLRTAGGLSGEKINQINKQIELKIDDWIGAHPGATENELRMANDRILRLTLAGLEGTETFFQPGRYTTAIDSGVPLLMDEFNQMPTNMRFSLKELYNRRPGDEVKIQEDSGIAHQIQEGFVWAATANIKSGKHKERFDLDGAESRVFEMKTIEYMPANEMYDLAMVSLMDKKGNAPLSIAEAQTTMKYLVDAAKEIQSGYNDELGNHYGMSGTRGEKPSLEKAVLDPGLVLRIVSGYKTEAARGVSFVDYLDERLLDFVSKGDYPDKDRELMIRIFMSKGFFQNTKAADFNLKNIKEDVLTPFRAAKKDGEAKEVSVDKKITLKQIAELDPFGKRAKLFANLGDEFLGEDDELDPESGNEQDLIGFENFNGILNWLKTETVTINGRVTPLESRLEGGSFEALINQQEQFYQDSKRYGHAFKIDRSKIKIETSRLKAIKAGLENGCVNFPLLTIMPDDITEEEKQMTDAEFAYHKLLAPLKGEALKIWAETGTARWSKLTLTEVLHSYIPVTVADFDAQKLEDNWQTEIARIIDQKKVAPKIQPGKITLSFIDGRQDVPADQKLINQDSDEVVNEKTFIKMIKSKINAVTPEQWITFAAQLYTKNQSYLSKNTWNFMMAVLNNKPEADEPVSAANADSDSGGVCLGSRRASNDNGNSRWRVAL